MSVRSHIFLRDKSVTVPIAHSSDYHDDNDAESTAHLSARLPQTPIEEPVVTVRSLCKLFFFLNATYLTINSLEYKVPCSPRALHTFQINIQLVPSVSRDFTIAF